LKAIENKYSYGDCATYRRGGVGMPRGKELEQLPMANTAPSIGRNPSKFDREVLASNVGGEQPMPSKVEKEGK